MPDAAQFNVLAQVLTAGIHTEMWISKERLEEFKAITRKRFGVELSDVEAHERAAALLDLFSLLLLEEESLRHDIDGPRERPVS